MKNRNDQKITRHQSKKEKDENLRGKNRSLIKEIKRLRKQLLKQEISELPEDIWEEYKEEEIRHISCPKCASEDVNTMELRGKIYLICQNCPHRGAL